MSVYVGNSIRSKFIKLDFFFFFRRFSGFVQFLIFFLALVLFLLACLLFNFVIKAIFRGRGSETAIKVFV